MPFLEEFLDESLHLSMSTRLDALLAQRAVQEGKTKAEIVRMALESYLAPQTPVERSLETLERTLNDRFDRLDRQLRDNQGQRSQNIPTNPTKDVLKNNLSAQNTLASSLAEHRNDRSDFADDEDEADEILPEFLEFASPAIQRLL